MTASKENKYTTEVFIFRYSTFLQRVKFINVVCKAYFLLLNSYFNVSKNRTKGRGRRTLEMQLDLFSMEQVNLLKKKILPLCKQMFRWPLIPTLKSSLAGNDEREAADGHGPNYSADSFTLQHQILS